MAKLKIHSENILPIIKKWLYSDKDIFLRELVANACDALSKCKVLGLEDELRVDINVDKEKKTITISDTGVGMTADEIKNYIAQIAFSGAEEFVSKYKDEQTEIIGHFGLGFYSAFMVSDVVEIDSLSHQDGAEAAYWECDGSSDYKMKKGSRETRGTTITLNVNSEEHLDENKLRSILDEHCKFLAFPIYLGETRINDKEPLWMKPPSECTDEEYLEFYRLIHPMEPDPIFWIHLNVDYPFHLKGILYFPKITPRFEFNKSNIRLFCNRMFVSDNCKDLIPDYLTVLRGVIDSPDIPLNVSRSMLQMDMTVRSLTKHISKKVSDRLSGLFKADRDEFVAKWPDIELIIKLGVLQDDKFYERMQDCLLFKTTVDEWKTVNELKEGKEKIFYTTSDDRMLTKLYQDQGHEVVYADSYLDAPLMNALEPKLAPLKFMRVDGSLDESITDKEKEKSVLDQDGKTEAHLLEELVKGELEGIDVEAKSLSSTTLPAFVMFTEESRRLRDYMKLSNGEMPGDILGKPKLVVNTNNPLIEGLPKLKAKDPALAKALVEQVYELSLLSQKELAPEKLSQFIERSSEVLEKLMSHATT
ncbi:MAG: Chaperone protein HtpG [Chlamydiia bacterium]|nr:Chaperone protein HtpG [Chlamydiia bacterium]MCH9630003.1 Chaperone protein HtpG [Chlamydiia bacterium]